MSNVPYFKTYRSPLPGAGVGVLGYPRLATTTEVRAGSDGLKALTPATHRDYHATAMFRALSGTGQTFSGGSPLTRVQLNLTGYDPDGVWDTTNYQFTAPETARYLFLASVYMNVAASGTDNHVGLLSLGRSGTTPWTFFQMSEQPADANQVFAMSGYWIGTLTQGQQVALYAANGNTASRTSPFGESYAFLEGYRYKKT